MPDPDEPYEPWRPAVGQRVRVRRSGECPSNHHVLNGCDDGHTGTIIVGSRPPVKDHPYVVLYDNPIPTGVSVPALLTGMRYAAAELEPGE
jgi:hypothetical protein